MSRVLSRSLGSRRSILLLLAIGVALLLTLGLFVDRSARSTGGDSGAEVGVEQPTDQPAAGTTEFATTNPTTGSSQATADEVDVTGSPRVTTTEDAADPAVGSAVAPVARDAIAGEGDVATGGGLDAPSVDAKIIRTASIELRMRRGGFENGWGDAQSVAAAFGGYIVSASRSGAGKSTRLGTITMRVPTAKFDAAVDRLRDLERAKVERLDVSSQDVTQEFVDTRSRLRHDRAVEGRLLALLAQTEGVSEVLAVQSRLDQVQEQIEVSRGRLEYLEKLTSMSTITVSLRAPSSGSGGRDADEGSVLGEAWADARERFSENVAGAIVWIGGALPALVMLVIVLVAGRLVWRRRFAEAGAPEARDTQV